MNARIRSAARSLVVSIASFAVFAIGTLSDSRVARGQPASPSVAPPASPSVAPPASMDEVILAARALEKTLSLDLEEASALLAQNPKGRSRELSLERARHAVYEGRCDAANEILSGSDGARFGDGGLVLEIARSCARATAGALTIADDSAGVEMRFQDDLDAPLAPLVVETIVRAKELLSRDLGVNFPKWTRVVMVRDLATLAAMTGLPYKAAQTTGTVAVAKWGRVTILSPRASAHGYGWRDTLAHELTHLAVTRATSDRAPLWLQEGVAKRQEWRWRAPNPFDQRPSADSIVKRGIALHLDLSLSKLGPSIAMLPSADAATVAYAEVTSFVDFLLAEIGSPMFGRFLSELRTRQDPEAALSSVTGLNLPAWEERWRGHLATTTDDPSASTLGLGARPTPQHVELRDRARLAELLLGRNHAEAAASELGLVNSPIAESDPNFRYLRARTLEALGKVGDAKAALAEPQSASASFGVYWAARGRLLRAPSAESIVRDSFFEAVAQDPFAVEASCEGKEDGSAPEDLRQKPLCDMSRRFDRDGFGIVGMARD